MDRGNAYPKRVILTRSSEDVERDRKIFESYGFEVVPLPLIKVERVETHENFERPDIVIFQSQKAVALFLERFSIPEGTKVIAVGDKTRRALEERGVRVDLVPKENSAMGILEELPEGKGELVLLPRSEEGRRELLEGLPKKGYRVVPLSLYRTSVVLYPRETLLRAVEMGGFILFASPSAVKGFFANLQREEALLILKRLVVVAIGKTTKEELENFGIVPNLVPEKPSVEEVAGKIHEFWQENCRY